MKRWPVSCLIALVLLTAAGCAISLHDLLTKGS